MFPPGPLHLVRLGALNKVYGELRSLVNLEQFEKSINVTRSEYHGGQFEGNECLKILKNVEKLEQIVNNHEFKPFIDAIWFIRLIDELVNKQEFEPQIREVIRAFKDTYIILMNNFHITMTNKIHIICDHLPDYLEESEKTLLKTSDQTIESTHSKLDSFLRSHGYF